MVDFGVPKEKGIDYKTVIALHMNRISFLSFQCARGPKDFETIMSLRNAVKNFEMDLVPFLGTKLDKRDDYVKMKAKIGLDSKTLIASRGGTLDDILEVYDKIQEWKGLLVAIAFDNHLLDATSPTYEARDIEEDLQ